MNKFFTILLIPEKTQQIRKFVVPAVYVRLAAVLGAIAAFFLGFMIYDYVTVMQEITENKRLQVENRQLKQQLQAFTNKLQNVENAMERIQTYTAKLRIITNQTGDNVEVLRKRAAPDIPGIPMDDHSPLPPGTEPQQPVNESAPPGSGKIDLILPGQPEILLADTSLREAMQALEDQRKAVQKKAIRDLVREDEARESDALREEFQKLDKAFDNVLQHTLNVELDVQSLHAALQDQADKIASFPTLRPTGGWYTSGFGVRRSPFTGRLTMHEGIDIANHSGSLIVAPAAGLVTFAQARPGYGNLVTIDHGYGIQTQYGHIARVFVRTGDKVQRGQKIAAVGNTGRSTGPHLHYEVRVNGVPINPKPYILED